jgi:hypothetical protein
MSSEWKVVIEPEGRNPAQRGEEGEGTNMGALIVYLQEGTDESTREEFGRVLFVRRNSKNPRTPFKRALRQLQDAAQDAVNAVNEAERKAEEARKPVGSF